MHESVREFVSRQIDLFEETTQTTIRRVIEFGSQDVNGGLRDLFGPVVMHTGLDIVPGVGVDAVYDGEHLPPVYHQSYDVAVCTNVFEHVENPVPVLKCMWGSLTNGGVAIIQAAGEGFTVHSGRKESLELEPGEFYRNVRQWELEKWLEQAGFSEFLVWERGQWPYDIYAVAEV